jgi:predicted component of type VI protein secretion system
VTQPPEDLQGHSLDADQQAVLKRELVAMMHGLHTLHDTLETDKALPGELTQAVLSTLEYGLADFSRISGFPTETASRVEDRSRLLREANARLTQLETQLGTMVSTTQACLAAKALAKKLDDWWDLEGFGYIRRFALTKQGHIEVDLSCNLYGNFALAHSSTPVSDKERRREWLQSLQARGFVLAEVEADHECELVDCDATRMALAALLVKRLPSLQINEYKNHVSQHGAYKGVSMLRSVRGHIFNLEDVEALPSDGQTQGAEQ